MGEALDRRPAAPSDDAGRMLAAVSCLLPGLARHAQALDRSGGFPAADIEALHRCGAMTAPLPRRLGGLGLGIEAGHGDALFELLHLIGSGSLAVGRLVEGHMNALRLIWRYGAEAQLARAAADAADGHLFGIWNTEAAPVRLAGDGTLAGRKVNCSAAGAATRAVITVDHPAHSRMVIVALAAGERAGAMPARLRGMRATQAGWIDFTGYRPQKEDWLGEQGDYLREPEFSAGAWRTLAVTAGGIEALGDTLRAQLQARGRDRAPHQAQRIAHSLVAEQTAFLWARECARLIGQDVGADALTAYVNLARRSVEIAGLAVIELTERSLGLGALIDSNPVERLLRDLSTYLRQPAMDEALAEAAAHFVSHPMPRLMEVES